MKTLAMLAMLVSIFAGLYVRFLIWFTNLGDLFY
jgi:hypothetical protein